MTAEQIVAPTTARFDFVRQKDDSKRLPLAIIRSIAIAHFAPVSLIEKTAEAVDKLGCDYWIRRSPAPDLAIDVKIRGRDCRAFQSDDIALETFSVLPGNQACPEGKPGWTRCVDKLTDYIVWYWSDTRRYLILPFPALSAAFVAHWQEWRQSFRTEQQDSGLWRSECVFVSVPVIRAAMIQWGSGVLPPV